jgi:hypothetical protein
MVQMSIAKLRDFMQLLFLLLTLLGDQERSTASSPKKFG